MIIVPLMRGLILSRREAAALENAFGMQELAIRTAEQMIETITKLGSASCDALDIAVDALTHGTDSDAALEQMRATLSAAYEELYGIPLE